MMTTAPSNTAVHDLCGISHTLKIASNASSLALREKICELFGPRIPTMRPLPVSLQKARVTVGDEPRDNKVTHKHPPSLYHPTVVQ